MITASNRQELYLLERFSSTEYFEQIIIAWRKFVAHNEACLDRYMRNPPRGLRNKPLPEQVDAVWGHHVLPNFRNTLKEVETGYQILLAGDLKGLPYAGGPLCDLKGQADFYYDWMTPDELQQYGDLLVAAVRLASNISATTHAYWNPGELGHDYSPGSQGALNAPEQWPRYQISREPALQTGQPFQLSGLYIPDLPHSCAQFLNARILTAAPKTSVLTGYEDLNDPVTGEKYAEQPKYAAMDCKWFRVVRVAGDDVVPSLPEEVHITQPVPAGERCPRPGFYFSTVRDDSRRQFSQGDLLPDFGSLYGLTIWQWDIDQTSRTGD